MRYTDADGNFFQLGYRGEHYMQNAIHDNFGELSFMGGYGVPLHRFEHHPERDGFEVQAGRREVIGGQESVHGW